MAIRTPVPNLVIARRVLDKIANATERFIADETGEAMVGLMIPGTNTGGVPTIYVLDTISPDETAVRQLHTFQQGDAWQDELIWWYQENWLLQREKRKESYGKAVKAKWDAPLRYLGDWHKQPGYMIAPSTGDLMTALDWLDDPENEMKALLVPIATLGHPPTTDDTAATVNYLTVPMEDGSLLRVDWWYIHRDVRMFQPINPVIYPNDQIPGLCAPPWHLKNEERGTEEFSRLQEDDLAFSVIFFDIDKELPLEVCITAARMGGSKIYLLATYAEYPERPPMMRLLPVRAMTEDQAIADVFDEWWEAAEPVEDPPGWVWTEDTYLVDYIRAVEDALGLRPEEAAPAPEETAGGDDKSEEDAEVAADDEATGDTEPEVED